MAEKQIPANWSKAAKLRTARKARSGGYYKTASGPTVLYVKCPECQEKVEAQDYAYGQSDIKKLDAAMMDHLDYYCGQD